MNVVCIQFPMYEILQVAVAQILWVELAQGPPKHSQVPSIRYGILNVL